MLSNIDTKYTNKSETQENVDATVNEAKLKMQRERIKLNTASTLKEFGGKRFLGLTRAGKRVFVSYNIKTDGSLTINLSHNLKVLLDKEAKLAGGRYTFNTNQQVKFSNEDMVRERKVQSGNVTIQTLHYIQRLKELTDIKFSKAFYKNAITKYFFMRVAQSIHTGGDNAQDVSYRHITKAWLFPEYNPYFNIEETWKYPDDL